MAFLYFCSKPSLPMNRTQTTLIVILLFILAHVSAQDQEPKIGLVLSGGGAKGLAHIGVLKVLEEEGIVPDYITGTSMGSIIGGLYAAGYSSHELDSIVRNVNWNLLLSDEIPLSMVLTHEKEDYSRYLAEFNITPDGLEIPTGLIRGQQIHSLLTGLTWHVAHIKSFDNLPIPFRCVAADLISGSQYIFKNGNLATAMRASMSIPTVFSPVKLDSMLLVDGGVLNNFPVKLCKEMGADIVIGVNVAFKAEPEEDKLNSFAGILMASATLRGNVSTREAISQTDLLISPNLTDFNTGSFYDAAKIIDLGEEAARQKIAEIQKLKDTTQNRINKPVEFEEKQNKKIRISKITTNGLTNINKQFLLGMLDIQPGDTISPDIMDERLKKAMGTRHFANITYCVDTLDNGYLVAFNIEESKQAKAKFAVHYDNEYKAGLLSNLTIRNFFGKTSRTSLTADISEAPEFKISQINFLGETQVMAAKMEFLYEQNKFPVYLDNGSKYGSFRHHYLTANTGFMTTLGTKWQMDAHVQYAKSVLQNESGFSDIFYAGVENFGNSLVSTNLDFTFSSVDSRYFPERGVNLGLYYRLNLDIQTHYKGSGQGKDLVEPMTRVPFNNYFSTGGNYHKYFPISQRFNIGLRLSGEFKSREAPFLNMTYIGGIPFNGRSNEVHFIGYSFREKLAENYGLGELNLRFRIHEKIHISALGSALYSTNNLPEEIEPIGIDKTKQVFGYGMTAAYDSFLGPLLIGAGSNHTDNRLRWFFNFGFNF